jgi:DNA-binding response OmpR family regulator
VVDDDPSINKMVAIALQRVGYGVDTATDGERGWDALRAEHFDLLLTDYSMPRLNGLDLLKRLRNSELDLPAIMMSADMPRDVSEIIELVSEGGALHKPFRIDELYFKVGLILDNASSAKARNPAGSTTIARNPLRAKRQQRQRSFEARMTQLATNLLAQESRVPKPAGEAPGLAMVCAKMETYLVNICGATGFRSIMARAIVQSQSEFGWLRDVRISQHGTIDDLLQAESHVPPAEALRGETAVVSRILGSLVSLLGEPLARSCLGAVWHENL